MKDELGAFGTILGQGWAHAITRAPVLVTLWWMAILHTVILAWYLPQRAYDHDFSVFYSAAIALRQHLDPYTTDLVPIGQRMNMKVWPLVHTTDTPFALLLFMPFSLGAPATSHSIWITLNGIALFGALTLLIRPKYSGLDVRMALLTAALALLYAPVTENFLFSQRQVLILLLLALMMRSLESGNDVRAGLLLALAAAYRVFPILMVGYFVVRGQWRLLRYTALGLALIGAVTIVMMGLPLCVSFLRGVRLAMAATSNPADVAIRGLIIRGFTHVFGDRFDGRHEIFQRASILFAQLAILVLTVMPTLRNLRQTVFDQRSYGLWVAATVVLSPLSWIHYMVLLLIPLIAIAEAASHNQCSRRALFAAVASYLMIAVTSHVRVNLIDALWWARGVRYFAEGSSIALLIGFLAAYWFAADTTISESTEQSRVQPCPLRAPQGPTAGAEHPAPNYS